MPCLETNFYTIYMHSVATVHSPCVLCRSVSRVVGRMELEIHINAKVDANKLFAFIILHHCSPFEILMLVFLELFEEIRILLINVVKG